ncbi:MBL fold metallo-hydrolase [Roseomonas sp. AR75]|uniref:MBL fold metallo-hydrolase n=1 Tax=Roseomonas sp. AR75 TaxID=2562311 RepID=UPI0010C0D948|nr:MBL fold metallo-hydrolase [Roseomonas sp. AR75]
MTSITRRAALAMGAASIPLAAGLSPAAAQATGPAFHRVPIGGLEAFVVTDGIAVRPDATQGFITNATPAQVSAAMQAAGLQGPALNNPFNVTVVKTPRGLVMLDVGRGIQGSQLIANMRAAGLDPAQVVLIVHTHFHGDHIGGLTDANGQAAFPNAPVMVPEREWAFWNDAGEESRAAPGRRPGFAMVRQKFAPYEGRVTTFRPGAEVAPGITALGTEGHSPGHNSFLVADGNAQLLVIGDVVNAPFFFMTNPEWVPIFDMDPPVAIEARKRLLDRAATDRLQVVGYHFPMPATGRVERAGTGYRLVPSNA